VRRRALARLARLHPAEYFRLLAEERVQYAVERALKEGVSRETSLPLVVRISRLRHYQRV
jgi:hypothetical protein